MKSCLIVDDSSTIRKITRCVMENLNFLCTEAENGALALEECRIAMPDVVILDWNMPVMNGIDFLVSLRKMTEGSYPKVLFCTSENGMDFIQKGISAGADEYIMKPFDEDIIASKLSQLGLISEHLSH